MKMLKEVLDKIDKIILNRANVIMDDVIKQICLIENKLKIKLPDELKEFYIRYNKNHYMLTAYYIFKSVDALKIEDEVLIIGYSNEYIEKYGISIADLNNACINVKVAAYDDTSNWLIYEELSKFIVNCVVFQTINLLEASAVLDDVEITLEEYFIPLYNVKGKDNKRISYISNKGDILGLHFIDENVVYFGSATDEILNEFEEKAKIDLDWL
ncbi:SMI1/KNR4 family protein [Clostridium estertheticum]|uniref:SMI1/KNR4 family protein n=1 Tax=Clostridium estertheticum TaxID=238834 RepID=UPI001CF3AEFC|nr:SMI1/KNR4 family protein [Clostridium estertheticum]MCB2362151.1 SMI1/KNR4 family protein [Clostridium estertheticum]